MVDIWRAGINRKMIDFKSFECRSVLGGVFTCVVHLCGSLVWDVVLENNPKKICTLIVKNCFYNSMETQN